MNRRPPLPEERRPPSSGAVSLRSVLESWLAEGRSQQWSARSLEGHRENIERFCWWLENEAEVRADLDALNAGHVRRFLAYLAEAHPTGRFGCTKNPAARRPARPSTVATYHRDLKSLTNFLIRD
jgi:hypothetical protein